MGICPVLKSLACSYMYMYTFKNILYVRVAYMYMYVVNNKCGAAALPFEVSLTNGGNRTEFAPQFVDS